MYYTFWLGSNWEKKTIFWDQSQINWDQFGSIPTPYHPKPRPTTPTDFSEISTILYQKEIGIFGLYKLILYILALTETTLSVKVQFEIFLGKWVWLEIFWPVRCCHRKGTQVADCWLERSKLRKSWNLQKSRPVYESRHSIVLDGIVLCCMILHEY